MVKIESVLYNQKLARKRIEAEGKPYGISDLSDLVLDEEDFDEARKMCRREERIVREGNSLTRRGLFRGMLYCLLTVQQDYERQIDVFESLKREGFDDSDKILGDRARFEELMKRVIYNNKKLEYIFDLAEKWREFNLLECVDGAVGSGIGKETLMREYLIHKIKGFGEKTASLFLRMCGAQELVPVDVHMASFLYFHGYPINIGRRLTNRSDDGKGPRKRKKAIRGKDYLQCEEFARNLASKYNVPAYLLQLAFWTKYSTYRK